PARSTGPHAPGPSCPTTAAASPAPTLSAPQPGPTAHRRPLAPPIQCAPRQAQRAARSTGMPGCPDGVPTAQIREQRRENTGAVEHLAGQLAAIPGGVAVTPGGAGGAGTAVPGPGLGPRPLPPGGP